MDIERVQASLHAAELCLAHGLWDSAVNRAYFALFQAAICKPRHGFLGHRHFW